LERELVFGLLSLVCLLFSILHKTLTDLASQHLPFSSCDRNRSLRHSTSSTRTVCPRPSFSFLRQLNDSSIPSNLSFEIDDAEDEWIFPQKFDYIHGRTLATCFKDPSSIIGKAFDALAPGGYFELQDMCLQTSDDGSMNGTALLEWQTHVKEAATKTGVEWTNVPNYQRWMIEKGFEDVTEVNFRWPSNQWSRVRKERLLGAWTQAQIDNGMLESVSTRLFMMKLGWEKERLDGFLARVRRDTKDPRIKAYSPM
jgi:hypothetical protein